MALRSWSREAMAVETSAPKATMPAMSGKCGGSGMCQSIARTSFSLHTDKFIRTLAAWSGSELPGGSMTAGLTTTPGLPELRCRASSKIASELRPGTNSYSPLPKSNWITTPGMDSNGGTMIPEYQAPKSYKCVFPWPLVSSSERYDS
eukprot:CAMPEP_0198523778 /NCGR_PEP_ID=MMETSP1462-20131121/22352_1 /TAXON_ID=1333877 /ORGANISM="Brandtodinium nutriculum, Strain RCC3387" /LENGTH=147 /DNA_ID=CAMNT_0044253487 /DNA_START=42 /DNA_END=485 /DNA_ORIENTATION=-